MVSDDIRRRMQFSIISLIRPRHHSLSASIYQTKPEYFRSFLACKSCCGACSSMTFVVLGEKSSDGMKAVHPLVSYWALSRETFWLKSSRHQNVFVIYTNFICCNCIITWFFITVGHHRRLPAIEPSESGCEMTAECRHRRMSKF